MYVSLETPINQYTGGVAGGRYSRLISKIRSRVPLKKQENSDSPLRIFEERALIVGFFQSIKGNHQYWVRRVHTGDEYQWDIQIHPDFEESFPIYQLIGKAIPGLKYQIYIKK